MPEVNGVHYDTADLELEIDGLGTSLNFMKVNWKFGRDVTPTTDKNGMLDGGELRGETEGTFDVDTTPEEFGVMQDAADQGFLGGDPLAVTLSYAKDGEAGHTLECDAIRFREVGNDNEKGANESVMKLVGIMLSVPSFDNKPLLQMPGSEGETSNPAAGRGAGGAGRFR